MTEAIRLRVIPLTKQERTLNCAVKEEEHLIIEGIGIERYIDNGNSTTPSLWQEVNQDCFWSYSDGTAHKKVDPSSAIHRPRHLIFYPDFKAVYNPSSGIIISILRTYPYSERIHSGWRDQERPDSQELEKWGECYNHQIWWKAIKAEEIDLVLANLELEGFKAYYYNGTKPQRPSVHVIETYQLGIDVDNITKYLKEIETYYQIKFPQKSKENLVKGCRL